MRSPIVLISSNSVVDMISVEQVDKWRPYVIEKEVAGYVEIYDTYTYSTIKGAGHEVRECSISLKLELLY